MNFLLTPPHFLLNSVRKRGQISQALRKPRSKALSTQYRSMGLLQIERGTLVTVGHVTVGHVGRMVAWPGARPSCYHLVKWSSQTGGETPDSIAETMFHHGTFHLSPCFTMFHPKHCMIALKRKFCNESACFFLTAIATGFESKGVSQNLRSSQQFAGLKTNRKSCSERFNEYPQWEIIRFVRFTWKHIKDRNQLNNVLFRSFYTNQNGSQPNIGILPCEKKKVQRRDKKERQIETARQGITMNRLIRHHHHWAALWSSTNLWFLNLMRRPKLGKRLQNVLPIHLHHRQGSQRDGNDMRRFQRFGDLDPTVIHYIVNGLYVWT